MYTTTELRTNNHKWHLAHDIRQTIANMSDEEKRRTLTEIKSRKFLRYAANEELCDYITALLEGRQPRNGISQERR